MTTPKDVASAFNRLRTEQGWVSRTVKKLECEIATFVKGAPPEGWGNMFEINKELKARCKNVETTASFIIEMGDKDEQDSATAKLNESMVVFEKGQKIYKDGMAAFQQPEGGPVQPPQAVQAQGRTGGLRTCQELKPRTLTADDTPGTMRMWEAKFMSYYRASNLKSVDVETQQSFLLACIDDELHEKISTRMTETSTVAELLGFIRAAFLVAYPIMHRRWNLLKHRQGVDEMYSTWIPKLMLEKKEADFLNMDHEEMWCMIVVHLTTDSKLQDKFFEIEKPTFDKLNEVAAQYESIAI